MAAFSRTVLRWLAPEQAGTTHAATGHTDGLSGSITDSTHVDETGRTHILHMLTGKQILLKHRPINLHRLPTPLSCGLHPRSNTGRP